LGYYAASGNSYRPIGRPETSLGNYHYSPRNNPEQLISRARNVFTAKQLLG